MCKEKSWRVLFVICAIGAMGFSAMADPIRPLLIAPSKVVSGPNTTIDVVVMNFSDTPLNYQFPAEFTGHLIVGGMTQNITLRRLESLEVILAPGTFSRQEYELPLPLHPGANVELSLAETPGQRITVQIAPPPRHPIEPGSLVGTSDPTVDGESKTAGPRTLKSDSAALDFFRAHFFPYEPMYLVMGWEDPKVKFQISFKYRLLNGDAVEPGWLVQKVPALTNVFLAYTQTSLWDTSAPSSPFYDTTYKPEAFYQWQHVDQGRWAESFRMDLQGGLQHASNGQDGPDSRSLNVVYFMPTFYWGDTDHFYLRFAPRVYAYIGDLEDNPDIADYYGHVQLRAMLGWSDSWQLAVIGTIGDGFHYGSAQLDLTYPLYRIGGRNFAVYLDLQYFVGYGESLLNYNERSSAFRLGFSLWR